MNFELITKMTSHFGQEGCLMYSKYCDYYKINPISTQEILQYHNLLQNQDNIPSSFSISKKNHLFCCLYYLTNQAPNESEFYRKMNKEIENKNELNNEDLILIFNIIDYDDKYLKPNFEKLKLFLSLLEFFPKSNLSLENRLLYEYYRNLIICYLNKNNEPFNNTEIKNIIKQANKENQYIYFIDLKNDLKKLKHDKKLHFNPEEQLSLMQNLYHRVKNYNKLLSTKLSLGMWTNLCLLQNYLGSVEILENSLQILKNSRIQKKNYIYFSLLISSRLGYVGLLTNNGNAIDCAINELHDCLNEIKKYLNDEKYKSLFIAYTFALNIIKLSCSQEIGDIKKIGNCFKTNFLINENDNFNKYIISKKNKIDCIINVFGCNNIDDNMRKEFLSVITPIYKKCQNENIKGKNAFYLIFGTNNLLNFLSEQYCIEKKNIQEREKYKNKILKFGGLVFDYLKLYYNKEPLLKTELIKSAIIRISSTCLQIYLYSKDLNSVQNSLNFFDDISKKIGINENTPTIELIKKMKGDYYYLKKDYRSAIKNYDESISIINDKSPKRPIIYFNMGICYYHIGNKNYAINCLNECVNGLKMIKNEPTIFDFYKRTEFIDKNIDVAMKMIDVMSKRK